MNEDTYRRKREYQRKRKAFLASNPLCQVCIALKLDPLPSVAVHHKKGRKHFYTDESTFLAVSRAGDLWIHRHPEEAIKLGLLDQNNTTQKRNQRKKKPGPEPA